MLPTSNLGSGNESTKDTNKHGSIQLINFKQLVNTSITRLVVRSPNIQTSVNGTNNVNILQNTTSRRSSQLWFPEHLFVYWLAQLFIQNKEVLPCLFCCALSHFCWPAQKGSSQQTGDWALVIDSLQFMFLFLSSGLLNTYGYLVLKWVTWNISKQKSCSVD